MTSRRAVVRACWLMVLAGCGGSDLDSSTGATDCTNIITQSCTASPTGLVDVGAVQRADAGSVCDPATGAASSTRCRDALTNLAETSFALDELASVYDSCVAGAGTGPAMDVACLCPLAARYARDFAAAGSPVAAYADGSLPAGRNAVAPYASTMTRVVSLCGAPNADAGTD